MDIYEYQVKQIFASHKIPVLNGAVAYTPEEAVSVANHLSASSFMVKAQVHNYNWESSYLKEVPDSVGKTVLKANSITEVADQSAFLIGKTLVDPETGITGQEIKKIYLEEFCEAVDTFAVSLRLDPLIQGIVLTYRNKEGKLFTLNAGSINSLQAHTIAKKMGLKTALLPKGASILKALYQILNQYHALAVEINPLILTKSNQLFALNGRIIFDSHALFMHPEISYLRDIDDGKEREALAHRYNFSYLRFQGNIACLTNGSGLGLATLDLIAHKKGKVACLLDVGTEPTKERVAKAFRLIMAEPDVEGILINILGDVTRCDIIAQGLIMAAQEVPPGVPLVVRMAGTNATVGERLLTESKLPFIITHTMAEAVERLIKELKGAQK